VITACQLCAAFRRPSPYNEAETGVSCPLCLAQLDAELDDLAGLALALPEALAPRSRSSSGGGGSSHAKPGPRLPVDLEALSLLGPASRVTKATALPPAFLLREWATSWAILRALDRSAVEREYATTPEGRTYLPARSVRELSNWLRRRLPWAAEHLGDFPRFAREVHQCVTETRRVTGEMTGLDQRPVGWCPSAVNDQGDLCRAPLSASAWDDLIRCPSCGAKYDRRRGEWETLTQRIRDLGLTRR
jgi:hypothetical protein